MKKLQDKLGKGYDKFYDNRDLKVINVENECYDENTGEHIGSCWSLEEAEELCRSNSCSTNLIPVEQARQLLLQMRKQRFKMRKKN